MSTRFYRRNASTEKCGTMGIAGNYKNENEERERNSKHEEDGDAFIHNQTWFTDPKIVRCSEAKVDFPNYPSYPAPFPSLITPNFPLSASPFGVVLEDRDFSSSAYRHGFNGMERDDEVKGSGNSYDFGARLYDSRLGRWLTVDPWSDKYPDLNPYNYVDNSPLRFIDPNGKGITAANDAGWELIKAMFEQFGTRDQVSSLFGLMFIEKTLDPDLTGGYYTTDKSNKQFHRDLKKFAKEQGWSKEKIKQAKSFYRTLKSPDVIEIGLIYTNTESNINGKGGSAGTSEKKLNTDNREMEQFLIAISEGKVSQKQLKERLEKNGGELPIGGSYGFYRDGNYSPSDTQPTDIPQLKGLLLINVPDKEGSFTYGELKNPASRKQIAETALQALSAISGNLKDSLSDPYKE